MNMPNFRITSERRLETLDKNGLPLQSRLATPAEVAMWERLSKLEPAVRAVIKVATLDYAVSIEDTWRETHEAVEQHLIPLVTPEEVL